VDVLLLDEEDEVGSPLPQQSTHRERIMKEELSAKIFVI